MSRRRPRGGRWLVPALVVAAGVLALLRPWTVVPIDTAAAPTFDPDEYVASVWPSRVLAFAEDSAIDLQAFLEQGAARAPEPGRRAVFVRGTAVVTAVDRSSRVGVARLRVSSNEAAPPVVLLIGPVLRGTAVRDALAFIRFTDFVNQLEYAAVANALNERVLTDVIGAIPLDDLDGHEATFVGAVALNDAAQTLEIVPVRLEPVRGAS